MLVCIYMVKGRLYFYKMTLQTKMLCHCYPRMTFSKNEMFE